MRQIYICFTGYIQLLFLSYSYSVDMKQKF